MICKNHNLIIQYEINPGDQTGIFPAKYSDSLELAENYLEERKKSIPELNWKLKEVKICTKCDYMEVKTLNKVGR